MTTTYRTKSALSAFRNLPLKRGFVFGLLIIVALIAFEAFNYSTTDFALGDLLGDLRFLGIRWATILAIAFCGIDFAGIARLFTPEKGAEEPAEVWYLFGAWLLGAAMNATLTWWGVSLAILNHETLGNAVVDRQTLLKVVPVFVAVLVWLIRVLIIGTFSVAGERLLWQDDDAREASQERRQFTNPRPITTNNHRPQINNPRPISGNPVAAFRPAPKATPPQSDYGYSRPEPTYSPLSAQPKTPGNSSQTRY